MHETEHKLRSFYRSSKRMPSYAELAALLGFHSKNAAYRTARKLRDQGFIDIDTEGKIVPGRTFQNLRLLGLVEAGFPTGAEEDIADTMSLDEYLIGNREAAYLLRVKGDSMMDAGIHEGDLVIAERSRPPKPGDIVIAEIDGGWTMKYLRKGKGGLYLEAANPRYEPIYPREELRVAAVVVGVVRKY
jgi:SOS regulatory protein LexA